MLDRIKKTKYYAADGAVGKKPYLMTYRHYFPSHKTNDSVLVLIGGGGHLMRVWEITPDGRKGWAVLFAEKGREVITVNWACNSPEIYSCSKKELCALTQRENMDLIKQVITREVSDKRKVVFLGWSMGGPQAFILATDIIPTLTAGIMGYAATGPLNYFFLPSSNKQKPLNLQRPATISGKIISHFCKTTGFNRKLQKQYADKYLLPFSPTMLAIQKKQTQVKEKWDILTIKNPKRIPPTLLIRGTSDDSYTAERVGLLAGWLRKFQKDISVKQVKGFSHLGMLGHRNDQLVGLYLDWLKQRGL